MTVVTVKFERARASTGRALKIDLATNRYRTMQATQELETLHAKVSSTSRHSASCGAKQIRAQTRSIAELN